MVNPILRQLIIKISTTIVKSVIQAYKNTTKNHRGHHQGANPFKEYFEKVVQQNPMAKKVMTKEEALKIFNMESQKEISPEKIMENYTKMFIKNNPSNGGSFYVQSKIWCAKEELLKDFPGAEEEYYKKHGVEDPTKQHTGKAEETAQNEANK